MLQIENSDGGVNRELRIKIEFIELDKSA